MQSITPQASITSDHEVNLKIFLVGLQKKNLIADYQPLFISMTQAVCQLVLSDNIAQSLCLSLEQLRCAETPSVYLQLAERLEVAGFFDRAVECFPQIKEVMSRPGQVITRPELAVLDGCKQNVPDSVDTGSVRLATGRMLRLLFVGLFSRTALQTVRKLSFRSSLSP